MIRGAQKHMSITIHGNGRYKIKFKFGKGLHIRNQHLNAILMSILSSDCKQTIWMIIQRELVIQITLIFFIGWSEMPFSAMENLKNCDHEREDYRDGNLKRSDLISRNHEKIENLLEPIHALKIDSQAALYRLIPQAPLYRLILKENPPVPYQLILE